MRWRRRLVDAEPEKIQRGGVRMAQSDKPESPLTYMLPEYVLNLLNLKNTSVLQGLIATPSLRDKIEAELLNRLGQIPDFEGPDGDVLAMLFSMTDADRTALSRIMAIYSQTELLMKTTDGKSLAAAVSFIDDRGILKQLRNNAPPVLDFIPALPALDAEQLSKFAKYLQRHMIGLLPEPCLLRLASRVEAGAFPLPIPLEDPKSRAALLAMIRMGLKYLSQKEAAENDEIHQAA